MINKKLKTVIDWIVKATEFQEGATVIDESTELLTRKILDSLQIMELICFLESQFSVQIPLEELTPENFANAEMIVQMVERAENRVETV